MYGPLSASLARGGGILLQDMAQLRRSMSHSQQASLSNKLSMKASAVSSRTHLSSIQTVTMVDSSPADVEGMSARTDNDSCAVDSEVEHKVCNQVLIMYAPFSKVVKSIAPALPAYGAICLPIQFCQIMCFKPVLYGGISVF